MIYKYYKFVSKERLRGHLSGELWFSNLDYLNDPFEGEVYIDEERLFKQACRYYALRSGVSQKDSEIFVSKLIESNQFSLEQNRVNLIKSIKKRTFSTSFSLVKDSILMWSHYSSDHTGYVIGYDFPENNYDMLASMGVKYPGYSLRKVEYKDERHALSDTIGGYDYPISLCRKAKDWSYEMEVRTVYTVPKSHELPGALLKINRRLIKSIYLGIKANFENYSQILIDFKRVKVFKMAPTSEKYALYPIKIHDV